MKLPVGIAVLFILVCSPALTQQYSYEKWPIHDDDWLYFDPPVEIEDIWREQLDEDNRVFSDGIRIIDAYDTYTVICRKWDEAGNFLPGSIRRESDDFTDEAEFAAAWYLVNERGSPFTMLQWAEACARHDMTW